MNGVLTGTVGALVEAWAQLRIGKLRVMLSLVGVGVAVAAMTFVIAFGQVSAAVNDQLMEQWNGRPGTVRLTVTPSGQAGSDTPADAQAAGAAALAAGAARGGATGVGGGGAENVATAAAGQSNAERVERAYAGFIERYRISHWATSDTTTLRLSLAGMPTNVSTTVVSGGYGIVHRTQVLQGRWFSADDEDDLSPSILVSRQVLDAMGVQELTGPLQVRGLAPVDTTYTIVGVLKGDGDSACYVDPQTGQEVCEGQLTAMVLDTPYYRLLPPTVERSVPTLEVWAGVGKGSEMETLMKNHFNAVFGHNSAQAQNNEFGTMGDFARTFTLVVTSAGVFIMVLGALGLINISMVTVRQRIHEIGVRRAFGATSRRIFFSIMLESVVATVVAGIIGIGVAIVAMRVVPLDALFNGFTVTNRPPFPMSAALIGLAAASGVGALAGIIPAVVAVRIRPIDAIRF
ncbi:ABC transporter permease [Actinomyces sp. W5033]|uniref:ABC transporter permease n=1 Tax=Actinomyces sp. W5033 TaxID=3446479 RepID=UPI003EE26BAC